MLNVFFVVQEKINYRTEVFEGGGEGDVIAVGDFEVFGLGAC